MADKCYVCGKLPLVSRKDRKGETLTYRVECRRCGTYDITQKLISGDKEQNFLVALERVRLSHAIRKATDAHGLFGETALDFETIKALAARNPVPDPVERGDLLISSIAQRAEYGEKTPNEHGETWAARIGMNDVGQVSLMAAELEELISTSLLPSGEVQFKLLLEGWRRAREIGRRRGPGNQAFVAMWFHPLMASTFDEGIAPALIDTGWRPYRVDRATHSNRIDDEIVAEINRSNLMVVDATGARNSAYWEAALAAGRETPVVWCCNASWQGYVLDVLPNSDNTPVARACRWTDTLAFDTRQLPCIFWDDPADLRKKLTDRIRALGFDAAWNREQ